MLLLARIFKCDKISNYFNFHNMTLRFLMVLILISANIQAQQSISFTPRTLYFEGQVSKLNPPTAMPEVTDFAAIWNGIDSIGGTLIEVNLNSFIPENAFIHKATLDLYANPTPTVSTGHISNEPTTNVSRFTRMLIPWNDLELPTRLLSTAANSVILPSTRFFNQDTLGLDMTTLVRNLQNSNTEDYGFLFSLFLPLANDSLAVNFAGSAHSDVSRRPVMTIEYSEPVCTTFTVGEGNNYDLYVSSFPGFVNENLNQVEDVAAFLETNGAVTYESHTLLKFDINSLPGDVSILGATLDLHGNPSPELSIGHIFTENNNTQIVRVLGPWDELTITWNTQPEYAMDTSIIQRGVFLRNASTLDIDVTPYVRDMYADPDSDFGLLMTPLLRTTQFGRIGVNYAGTVDEIQNRPSLKVCYEASSSILDNEQQFAALNVYPNPADSYLSIEHGFHERAEAQITNMQGQTLMTFVINGSISSSHTQDISALGAGYYILDLKSESSFAQKKFVVED